MNSRILIGGILGMVCVVALWKGLAQRQELSSLRGERERQEAQGSAATNGTAFEAKPGTEAGELQTGDAAVPSADASKRELLQLRAKVTRLSDRQRELAGLRAENERLRAQVAARGTNTSSATALPPGYIMRTKAQFLGYNTPEDAVQSFLWAVQNQDLNNVLQAVTPEMAQQIQRELQQAGGSTEKLFAQGLGHLPGLRIVESQPQTDGSVALKVEIMPGDPQTQLIHARMIDGQWKLDFGR